MSENGVEPASGGRTWLVALGVLALLALGAWWLQDSLDAWTCSDTLEKALRPYLKDDGSDKAQAAQAILGNFQETRSNASRWSGVYWGFTFIAAAFSALAALVLKLETLIKNEGAKKDLAALLSVVGAVLMTISTSGDFQRKWQANRVAAAELEHAGYEFLQKDGANARAFLAQVGQIQMRRHMAIVGGMEQKTPPPEKDKPAPPGK